jgi:hypothetical protein
LGELGIEVEMKILRDLGIKKGNDFLDMGPI